MHFLAGWGFRRRKCANRGSHEAVRDECCEITRRLWDCEIISRLSSLILLLSDWSADCLEQPEGTPQGLLELVASVFIKLVRVIRIEGYIYILHATCQLAAPPFVPHAASTAHVSPEVADTTVLSSYPW